MGRDVLISKHFAVLVMAVVMLCTINPVTNAAVVSNSVANVENVIAITPFWVNTSEVTVTLSYSGTTAIRSGVIDGLPGTTRIVADFVLERRISNNNYTVVKRFPTRTVNSASLRFSDNTTITKGETYRLSVTAVVTRNGTTETVSNWVERKA